MAGLLCGLSSWGQPDWDPTPVEVEEVRDAMFDVATDLATDPATIADDDTAIAGLYYRIQLLEDELRRLQGVVEEQSHRIDRLTQEQRERYFDLDQRLLQRSVNHTAPRSGEISPPVANPPPQAGDGAERQLYADALQTMKAAQTLPPAERNPELTTALELFQALIDSYPNGSLTDDAFYWTGEIHLAQGDLESARQAFARLIGARADHPKVPQALYKLGVVFHRLGEDAEALRVLDRVINEFPDHSAARLASAYSEGLR